MMQPKETATLTEMLRERIAESIFTGQLKPGEPLDDRALSQRYQTSRTPVREALLQLAGQGLVDVVPRSGMSVARLDHRELISMMEMTAELEGVAARLAARRMNGDARRRLQAIHLSNGPHVERNDVDAYRLGNTAFHEAIYAGCANELLARQIRDLRRRVAMYRHDDVFENPQRPRVSHGEHGEICEAIAAGDGDRAQKAAIAHITSGGAAFVDLLMLSR